ncbi:unnamed protein product [marine sediment metagenome]|uniref:Uncharacterized protein n=1 Tax=marine sediment metagenome TaxID=412755 RepID=X1NQR0_9ZZZZ
MDEKQKGSGMAIAACVIVTILAAGGVGAYFLTGEELSTPTLLSPSDDSETTDNTPTFEWEIVGHMMEMGEFTVPDLMRRVRVSRITVWRLVQKMIGQGLVQETEKVGLTANGRGGRGKPSRVYRYTNIKGSPKGETGPVSKP